MKVGRLEIVGADREEDLVSLRFHERTCRRAEHWRQGVTFRTRRLSWRIASGTALSGNSRNSIAPLPRGYLTLGANAAGPRKSLCNKERATGLEPATSSLGSWHSTN